MKRIYAVMFVCLMSLSASYSVSGAEPEPASATQKRLGLNTERYYRMGYDTARQDYTGMWSFAAGTFTGMVLPAVMVGVVDATSDTHELVGMAASAITLTTVLWGGNSLSKRMPEPAADSHTAGLSGTEQQMFEQGYAQHIHSIRARSYKIGIVAGIVLDIYVFGRLLAD